MDCNPGFGRIVSALEEPPLQAIWVRPFPSFTTSCNFLARRHTLVGTADGVRRLGPSGDLLEERVAPTGGWDRVNVSPTGRYALVTGANAFALIDLAGGEVVLTSSIREHGSTQFIAGGLLDDETFSLLGRTANGVSLLRMGRAGRRLEAIEFPGLEVSWGGWKSGARGYVVGVRTSNVEELRFVTADGRMTALRGIAETWPDEHDDETSVLVTTSGGRERYRVATGEVVAAQPGCYIVADCERYTLQRCGEEAVLTMVDPSMQRRGPDLPASIQPLACTHEWILGIDGNRYVRVAVQSGQTTSGPEVEGVPSAHFLTRRNAALLSSGPTRTAVWAW